MRQKPGWLLRELEAKAALATRSKDTLRGYQRDKLIPFLHDHPFSGAFVDMGLGKTVSVLTMLSDLFERGEIRKALVIAPLRVTVQTWPTELREWQHTWWMTHTIIRPDPSHPELRAFRSRARAAAKAEGWGEELIAAGRAVADHMLLQRKQLTRADTMIHLINREMVKWLVDFWGDRWPYDTVIVDESTSFSDHRTQRWKALNRVRPYMKRLHLLSGIPAPEGIEDYFAQIYLLDRGKRFGKSITQFRNNYITENQYSRKKEPVEGAEKEVAARIADICIVMRQEDYLGRAEPLVVERPIVLDPDQLKRYKKFERDLVLKLPDGEEIEALNGAALGQKLMQFASGAVYDEDRNVHNVHNHKLEDIMQLREEAQGSPLMIAYWHKSSLARLQRLLPKAIKMDRTGACVDDWNRGKIQDLLIHPASAGHGLNMQSGPGHTIAFFDNPWSLELYKQIIARLDRPGQKNAVRVFHLTTRDTLDDRVVPALRQKHDAQDLVRKYIRDVRDKALTKRVVM